MKKRLPAIFVTLVALMLTACAAPKPPETSGPTSSPVMSDALDMPVSPDAMATPPAPSPAKAEYIKLTPQDAEVMMSGDVVVLDVRTQEEYDEGHIRNAVLLPDYEVAEKAESVISDQNQRVLVYCRTGIRSEAAARTLIELGYTKVYDFGGIVDWTGDIITPFNYTVTRNISSGMPEFSFRIDGEIVRNREEGRDYNNIYKLTIWGNDGSFKQEIADLTTATPLMEEIMYGLSFDDWNFDGFLDISLWKYSGGTMLNSPHYYWLWNNNTKKFEANAELEEISYSATVWIPEKSEHVESYTRLGNGGYFTGIYEYIDGMFVPTMSELVEFDWEQYNEQGKTVYHTVIEKLIGGEMVITEEYDTEYDD